MGAALAIILFIYLFIFFFFFFFFFLQQKCINVSENTLATTINEFSINQLVKLTML